MAAQSFSVSELLTSIYAALRVCFPDEVWVEGEISALKAVPLDAANPRAGRHIFFNLVDPETEGMPSSGRPVLPVKLFDSQRQRVNAFLKRQGSIKMSDGVRVRISGRLQFYPARSQVELLMNLIDPAYTLALLANERDRVLRVLAADGLLDRNRALPIPPVPLRVGVVTSSGSAAAADFLHELGQSGFAWHVQLAHTRVQGAGAEESIASAVDRLASRGVDVIAVVRGGGARTELGTFDAEPVARSIATSTVPVITGIGHEIDDSIADRVAHTAYKTPTACAASLVEHVGAYLGAIEAGWDEVRRVADHACRRAGQHIDHAASSVDARTRGQLGGAQRSLDHAATSVRVSGRRAIAARTETLGHLEARVRSLDPERALARGWTITRTAGGRTVRSAVDLRNGERLVTTFVDGEISSIVETAEGRAT